MLIPLAPRLLLLVLVSLQTHSTLFLVPALGLVNAFIPEDALVLVALSDPPPGVSQLLRTLGKHLLSPLLPLRRRKVKRRRLSAPEGRTHSMSWDDQVSAEESRGLASGVICTPQAPLSTSLMPHGPNHGTAESSSEIEGGSAVAGTCDTLVIHDCNNLVTRDYNHDSLPQASQPVTSNIVTPNVTYDCDL